MMSPTSRRLPILRTSGSLFILSGLLLGGVPESPAFGARANARPAPAPQPAPQPAARQDEPTPARPRPIAQPVDNVQEVEGEDEAPDMDVEGDAIANDDEADDRPAATTPRERRPRNPVEASRRPIIKGPIDRLGFSDVSVDSFIDFIRDCTGKTVVTKPNNIKNTKLTVFREGPLTTDEALDILYEVFRINKIGVVETESMVVIDQITEIPTLGRAFLGPEVDVTAYSDDGNFYDKVFQLEIADAEIVVDLLADAMNDYTPQPVADPNTNQIIVYRSDISLLKRLQAIIDSVDKPPQAKVNKETFRIVYADAQAIADNLRDIFEDAATGNRAGVRPGGSNQNQGGRRGGPAQPSGGGESAVGVSEQLRITVLPAINTITVSAEPEIMEEIRAQIHEWDQPRAKEIVKIYTLNYADPLIMRDTLQAMLQGGTTSRAGGGGRSGGRAAGGGTIPGGAGDGSADVAVRDLYKIEAYADARQLVVISKTPENLDWLDQLVAQIDQPSPIAKPELVLLKYADAVEIAEQLNALLAPAGTDVSIAGQETGLTRDEIGRNTLVGGEGGGSDGRSDTGGADGGAGGSGNEINFPWASGRADGGEVTPESPMIGKTRIVPIIRQNALSILAAPEYRKALKEIIESMDRPGRQVLIAATIAQVELRDEFAWGIRVGNDNISPALSDNLITGSASSENSKDGFISGFTTSVLNVNFDVNATLQALDQKTDVKIVQQPKIFTADNQEAVFLQGQDVPFVSNSQFTDEGTQNTTTDYVFVGVTLNVRPRITAEKDVSIELALELSSVVPGQTLFGAAILDRRRTETRAVIKNGQTIVVSGIRTENESDVTRRVPVLGEIPLIGALFTSTDKASVATELIAFITPIVVDNPSENYENFNAEGLERRDIMNRPLKELKEDKSLNRMTPFENRQLDDINAEREAKGLPANEPVSPTDTAPRGEL